MIIGLCGLAGSGKDEVGAILSRRWRFAVISFAGPIYKAVSEITGMPPAALKDRALKERVIPWLGRSPRELLQTLGTEWGREMVCQEIWVQIALRRAAEYMADGWNVAITDCRFPNEAEAIHAASGQVWRVERPGAGLGGGTGEHASESGLPEHMVDHVLKNDGSLAELEAAVDAAMRRLPDRRMEVSPR